MYLLNVDTLALEIFYDTKTPQYAILSHTWDEEEVTFADIQRRDMLKLNSLAGFAKIQKTCDQARIDHFQYVWIDTCCIDKRSSAELSEAINSMFRWYQQASICYAYLSDVTKDVSREEFPKSRWFTRGWTLQELLAPRHLVFYDRDWQSLGTKSEHAVWLSDITGIQLNALLPANQYVDFGLTGSRLGRFCIAKRMSWASNRETTRVEDIAYCLLGIFDITMPLLYGERERAFFRLQEVLITSCYDDSILAWGLDTKILDPLDSGFVPKVVAEAIRGDAPSGWQITPKWQTPVLASSPADFRNCNGLVYAASSSIQSSTINNAGLQIELPLIAFYSPTPSHYGFESPDEVQGWIGLLSCSTGAASTFLGIILKPEGYADQAALTAVRATYKRAWADRAWRTLLVGPRLAMQAERRNITIFQQSESKIARERSGMHTQFIVNESPALINAGYGISYGTFGTGIDFLDSLADCRPVWDNDARILTNTGDSFSHGLLGFAFTGSCSSPGFTVFVLGSKFMVCEGQSMDPVQKKNAYEFLIEVEHAAPDMMIQSGDGYNKLVTVALEERTVYFTRIVELNVDLVDRPAKIRGTARVNAVLCWGKSA